MGNCSVAVLMNISCGEAVKIFPKCGVAVMEMPSVCSFVCFSKAVLTLQ